MLNLRPTSRLLLQAQRAYSTPAALTQWIASSPQIRLVQTDTISLPRIQGLVSSLETDGPASAYKVG